MSNPPDAQRYRIEEFLGAGGTGQVYRAWDNVLRRPVALKLLRERSADMLDRALQEARAQALVSHPNLCKVFDVGRQDGKAYIASELIGGPSLADVPALPIDQVVGLMRDVALAVHAGHLQGLVHRDLKPQNVLLEEPGFLVPRVVDFGIAQVELEPGEDQQNSSSGTPAYMAPEQVRGGPESVDRAVDVYALGGLLHYLLSGKPPFEAEHPIELLKMVLQKDPPRLRALRSDISKELDAIVFRCLEKVPGRRYSSALALADDLERALAERPVSVLPQTRRYLTTKFVRRNPVAVLAVVGLVVAGLVLGLFALRGRAQAQRQSQLARDFGARAEQLGSRMQLAHLSGTGDLGPVRDVVEREMNKLAKSARELGTIAVGPGESALGFANLRMGQVEIAVRHFENAWSAGSRGPDVALGLAESMARRYAEEQRTLYYLSATVRRLRQDQLHKTFLTPALERLEAGLAQVDPKSRTDMAYLNALAAFLEDRHEDLKPLVELASQQEPFRYEALLLEGYSARSQSVLQELAGDLDAVRPLLEEAEAAFARAAQVGRSDPKVFQELCMTKEALVYQSLRESLDDPEELSSACQRGIDLAPLDPGPYRARAGLLQRLALTKARRGDEYLADLAAAREHLEHAMTLAPDEAGLQVLMATQYLLELNLRSWHDSADRVVPAQAAADHARRALELDPESVWAPFVLGQTHYALAREQAEVGIDPSQAVAAGKRHFERAIELAPEVGRTYSSYGNLLDWFAVVQSESLGQDPRSYSDAAKAALHKAIDLEPRNVVPVGALGVAHLTMAGHYQRTGLDPREEVAAGQTAINRALELRPQHVVSLSNLSELWLTAVEFELAEGSPEEAYENHREALEQAAALDPDEFGCSLAKSDWYQARIDVLRKRTPKSAIDRGLARTETMLKRVGESRTCMRDRARLLLERGRFLRSTSDGAHAKDLLDEGKQLIDVLIERNPKDYQAWFLRAEYALFLADGDMLDESAARTKATEALEAYRQTLRLSPGIAAAQIGQRRAESVLVSSGGS